MAHNFKLTGDYYVSVDGSDSNNGLTKDTPKRTVQAGLNLITTAAKTLIIGAGVYNETISKTTSVGGNLYIYGDGIVVLDGSYGKTLTLSTSNTSHNIYDLNFVNYNVLNLSLGAIYTRCKFSNTSINQTFSTNVFYNSVFVNSPFVGTTPSHFYSCCVFNSQLNLITLFKDSYCNSFSIVAVGSTTTTTNFNYNNIEGKITMQSASSVTSGVYQDIYGRYYDLSITTSTGSGTSVDPYGRPLTSGTAFSYSTHRILYPTYNANSISADPQFNNIQAQDFTLQASSPMIGKASDGISNIGGTKYAIRHTAKGDAFNTSAISVTDLSFQGNDYKITSPATTGEVVSAPIAVSTPSAKVVQKITYNGLLEFNKLITGGTVGNQQVPDAYTYASTAQPPNVAGANPDRLVYEMRYSTQASQPTSSGEWDNGGLWTAGNYGIFEWNTKPSVDNLGVGNGDPAFNAAATPVYLNATWIQIKVKLRNNYA